MEEKTFFEHENVKVTNARFLVGEQTFAMSNITSVSSSQDRHSRVGPIILLIVGFVMCCASIVVAGLIVMAVGVLWLMLQKTKYHVMLRTSGGETKALTSFALNNSVLSSRAVGSRP